jgi:hypothetical protein
MSGHSKHARSKLLNIAEFLTEDIPDMNKVELANALAEEGLDESAAVDIARAAFESAKHQFNARRFAIARREIAGRTPAQPVRSARFEPEQAKHVLAAYFARNPDAVSMPTTMAARNGGDLPEETALEIVQALIELGEISEDGQPR